MVRFLATSLHPALLIAAWCTFAILTQRLDPVQLGLMSLPVLALVAVHAPREALRLLKRSRWLLLAIAVLFVAATPGERLPGTAGSLGLTLDGLRFAAEHLLRLVLLLATLASLLRQLGRDGLLAGLHVLLLPIGRRRERLVVRLMLALEFAEGDPPAKGWRDWLGESSREGPDRIRIPRLRLGCRDAIALGVLATCAIGVLLL